MTLSIPQNITLTEFLQLPLIDQSPAWEYVNGEAIQKPMGGGKHSALQKCLIAVIDQAGSSYEAFPELRCTFGGRSVVPDVTVIANDQIPLDESGEIISTGINFAPSWLIEILSSDQSQTSQSQTRVTGNILHCLKQGSQLAWLVDPHDRSVLIYHADRVPELLTERDLLPVLAEVSLSLSVDQVFGWLRRTK